VEKGQRIWKEFFDISLSTDDFEDIGKAFESEYPYLVNRGKVGYADSLLIPQKELVDFATRWMSENRE
jgi:aminoglycoside 3-N-acetyltransferase